MLRKLYYKLPIRGRFFFRKLYYFPIDMYDALSGRRKIMEPKKGDIFIGSGDFIVQGLHQVDLLKKYTKISPTDHVLDVGCGIGRTAVALTSFLSSNARYDGFDIVKKGINWCTKNISTRFPHFHFLHAPLHNDLYAKSKRKAHQFSFPYTDSSFHTVFLFSVFTHMEVSEIDHYLSEIKRVLKENGYCLATFFIYTERQEEMIKAQNEFSFPYGYSGYRLMDNDVKAANIAIEFRTLERLCCRHDIRIDHYIEGYWKSNVDKSDHNSFQDVIVLR